MARKLVFILAVITITITMLVGGCHPKDKETCIEIFQKEKKGFYYAATIRDSLFRSYPACARFVFNNTKKLFGEHCDSPKNVKYMPRELLHFKHSKELRGFTYDAELHYIVMEQHRIKFIFDGIDPFRILQLDSPNHQYDAYRIDSSFYLFSDEEYALLH